MAKETKVQRMLEVRVVAPDLAGYKRTMQLVWAYRMLWQKVAATANSFEVAGGEVKVGEDFVRLTPKSANSLAIAKAVLGEGTKGKAPYYEVRDLFFRFNAEMRAKDADIPEFNSGMWDSLRQQLNATMRRANPELKISQNCLIVSAEARVPMANGIGVPVMRCYGDKYSRTYAHLHRDELGSYSFTLDVGSAEHPAQVKLIASGPFDLNGKIELKKINDGAAYVLSKLMAGQEHLENRPKGVPVEKHMRGFWEWKTPVLNLRKSKGAFKLSLLIPYARPAVQVKDLNRNRDMEVHFCRDVDAKGRTGLIHMRVALESSTKKTDVWRKDSIRVDDVSALLCGIDAQRRKLDILIEAARNGTKGQRKYRASISAELKSFSERSSGLAKRRSSFERDRNHIWANMVLGRAKYWGCGKITVFGIPDGKTEGVCGRPWDWAMFKRFLEYKAKEQGFALAWVERKDAETTLNLLKAGQSLEENAESAA